MEMQESEGRLGRLKKVLYERGVSMRSRKRTALPPHEAAGAVAWKVEEAPEKEIPMRKKMPLGTKFFIGSLLFFVVALVVAAAMFFGGGNIVSTKNVEILVTGPIATPAGEEVPLEIIIENRNNVPLESAELLIEYPGGTRDASAMEQELTRSRKTLGEIAPGEVVKEPLRIVFFGQEGDEKNLRITLEYRTKDSNAIFANEKEYRANISSSATSLTASVPSEVIAGQMFEVVVTLVSNANTVTENILAAAEYPLGFSYVGATPPPSYGNNAWFLGDIAPGGRRTVTIRGTVEGQDGDEKVFRISSGTPRSDDSEAIGITYNSLVSGTTIARPFLSTIFFVNGESLSEYVIDPETRANVDIAWVNNLPTKIINARIEAVITGDVLDIASVDPKDGFFRSSDKTIVWDKDSDEGLAEVEPGEQGKVSFRFRTKSLFTGGKLFEDPLVAVSVTASGNRISGEGVPERIENTIRRDIKVNSAVVFTPRIVYSTGPITNSGPLPPVADKETTYTVIWTALNSSNGLSRVSARAVLPPYVSWKGVVSPQSETVSYNEATREVVWNLGRVSAGAGITKPPREVLFQVGFVPSMSHVGQSPTVAGEVSFSGADDFTGSSFERSGKAVTTALNTDPNFVFTQGTVIKEGTNGN